ncbi:unnamed protein product [Phytophthora fragariaefolia]|uniref:Unnamed protein product n=1 Tax=Phytophthora fragariaefolia TaxID=1490495 RepID=A0A9W7D1K2_9STRA|nr:unnamed protein product [Phytophthora fragariaefolia]
MKSSETFRRRELRCHQRVSVVNDRSSYVARRLSELDVLSAIGSIVNASQGREVAEFVQIEASRTGWLCLIQRTLLERHFLRLLRFYPSLGDTCKHLRSNSSDITVEEGRDDYKSLIHFVVFALLEKCLLGGDESAEVEIEPRQLSRLLHWARQKALPILVDWLLADCAPTQPRLLINQTQRNSLDSLLVSVRQELEATRVFVTGLLTALGKQAPEAGTPMATHIPETFLCDGQEPDLLTFKDELDELRASYAEAHCSSNAPRIAIQKDILDPSMRCRVYYDGKVRMYQWLPTEFHVDANGGVKVLSPLHGSVHPNQFPAFYAAIPNLLGRVLPLFESVLGKILTQEPPPPYHIGLGSFHRCTRKVVGHSGTFSEQYDSSSSVVRLRDRQLQVVVKLSTVELDDAHPRFPGDGRDKLNRGWQLDGDDHEQIVSVGYHVLRSRNITPPRLAFRAFAHDATAVAESEHASQQDVFLSFGERTSSFHSGEYGRQFLQQWGSFVLHEGRSIAVPSFLAHRLERFELLDPTHPDGGELTLATFYLVDPTKEPIVSTRTVCPKQWQQTRRFVQANVGMLHWSLLHPFLPDEVLTKIAEFAVSHISESQVQLTRENTLAHRQKLQELRFMAPSLRVEEEILLHR